MSGENDRPTAPRRRGSSPGDRSPNPTRMRTATVPGKRPATPPPVPAPARTRPTKTATRRPSPPRGSNPPRPARKRVSPPSAPQTARRRTGTFGPMLPKSFGTLSMPRYRGPTGRNSEVGRIGSASQRSRPASTLSEARHLSRTARQARPTRPPTPGTTAGAGSRSGATCRTSPAPRGR